MAIGLADPGGAEPAGRCRRPGQPLQGHGRGRYSGSWYRILLQLIQYLNSISQR